MTWKTLLHSIAILTAFVLSACTLPGGSGTSSGKVTNRMITLGWRDNTLAVPVEIQGARGCMMVDTGSYDTYLNTRVAGAMGVALRKTNVRIRGIAGAQGNVMEGKISGRVRGLDPKAFGSLSGEHRFRTMPDQFVPGMGTSMGNLGLEQLADANALVDCAAGTLTIAASGAAHALPSGWRELPLVKHRFDSGGFMWVVPVTIGSADGLMIVDTLAGVSLVGESFARSIGMGLSPSSVTAYGVGGLTGSLKEGQTPELMVGGAVNLGRIEVLSSSMKIFERADRNAQGKTVPIVGLLGMDQLVRMKARFDCARGVLQVPQ